MKMDQIKTWVADNREVIVLLMSSVIVSLLGIESNSEKLSQVTFLLCGAFLSVAMTLLIVERVAKKNWERQHEIIVHSTYGVILSLLAIITLNIYREYARDILVDPTEGETDPNVEIIKRNLFRLSPKKEVDTAIVKIAKTVEDIIQVENSLLRQFKKEGDLASMDGLYNDAIKRATECYSMNRDIFTELRVVQIPRVLQYSDNQEINLMLSNFNYLMIGFEDIHSRQRRFLSEGITSSEIYDHITPFIETAGIIYAYLRYEVQKYDKQ